MKTNDQKEMARKMDKQGTRVYVGFSAVVYLLAIAYCYFTNHIFETGLLGVVMLGLGILIVKMYKSM
jgi:hypothetical protein